MTNQQEEHIDNIVETLSKLSVSDLSKLKKALEEAWDVRATAVASAMPGAMPPEEGGAATAEQESTDFQVILDEVPADKKIAAIKVVREVTGLNLKDAKGLVEGTPSVIKESAPKAEAEECRKKLVDAGAKVTLKGL
ncbi:MAG: 50S ribosomal protein L7/L12 [Simkaniaceae bacterium]|nr:50S ribosomal protein L7/L12 [Simkaniaceae bacterium]